MGLARKELAIAMADGGEFRQRRGKVPARTTESAPATAKVEEVEDASLVSILVESVLGKNVWQPGLTMG